MKVHFVLPTEGSEPVGGYKVVYEYANALVGLGHQVVVTHAFYLLGDELANLRRLRPWLRFFKSLLTGRYRPDAWFSIAPSVRLRLVPCLHPVFMPKADAVVATAWQTAEWAARLGPRAGRKFYLIQHFEDWSGERARVLRTWKLPLHKIVIARWLQTMAHEMGERATYITNGLDFRAFGQDNSIENRVPCIGMLLHTASWKGSSIGLEAIAEVRRARPEVQVILFGVRERPADLPADIDYAKLPTQVELRRIYNRVTIFLGPSLTEGWGLPPAEAMVCGAAVVLTDIGGHREFAVHEHNCLMVPPSDAPAMAAAVERLLADEATRVRLARAGRESIQQFTWAKAAALFDKTLTAPMAEAS